MTVARSGRSWLAMAVAAMKWSMAAVAVAVPASFVFVLLLSLTTPDTPENAVIGLAMDRWSGDLDGAEERLCDHLRQPAGADERRVIEEMDLDTVSLIGDGLLWKRGDDADVAIEFRVPDPSAVVYTAPWVAHMTREHGHWTVCGFEPATRAGRRGS